MSTASSPTASSWIPGPRRTPSRSLLLSSVSRLVSSQMKTRLLVGCVGLLAASCFQPAAETCSGNVVCPNGYRCTADGKACRAQTSTCGNGTLDTGESCDDGNITDCDGCSSD